jgi:16S rRNA G1207 methylase RsmC
VVNDSWGALSVALAPQALWTDSALSALALRRNERANARVETPVVWSTATPAGAADLVVLRIPKHRPLFEYQLAQLARSLPVGATVLAAGMDKHLSVHTAHMLERIIGPTERLPGERKARLFRAVKATRVAPQCTTTATYYCELLGGELHGLPNVFSREQLDSGSRFLLQHLHRLEPVETAIDLACGNGVLGLVAVKQGLAQRAVFCDESALAVASAELNARRLLPRAAASFRFHHGDGFHGYEGDAAHLVLCNPPFHQDHTVNAHAGRHLLNQCSRQLLPGGCLLLVANRHIDYTPLLKRRFEHVEKCAGNSRFNLLLARRA